MMRMVVVMLVAVCGLATVVVAANAQEGDAPPTLRVMSYNIKHGRGMDGKVDIARIAVVIAKEKPDLVALQEVDNGCTRSGNVDIAAELGRRLGMHHGFGKFMNYQGGQYGMAVLSRFPIRKLTRHVLPTGAEPRCALEIQVDIAGLGKPASFVCIHNDWTNEAIRVKQVSALLKSLDAKDRPVILAGDFNGERDDASVKLLRDDGWSILGDGKAKTFPSDKPRVEIDFFITKNVANRVVEHRVVDERVASDHRPIVGVFELVE